MRKLIKGIHHFQTHYFASHREMFEQLSLGQHPRTLFITCCDSRIDPNLITLAQIQEQLPAPLLVNGMKTPSLPV